MSRAAPTPWVGGLVVFRYVDDGARPRGVFAADIRMVTALGEGAPSPGA